MPLAIWTATVQDAAGNAVAGCKIEVRNEDTGLLARLYSDRDGLVGKSNSFTAPDATFSFYAAGGAYRVTATKAGFSAEWRFVALGTMQEQDVEGIVFALQAGIVPALTAADLELYTPPVPDEGEALPRGGVVYADPVAANNGYWVYSFADEEWQWARPLFDTLARLTIVGGDENAIVATASPGINPASVIAFFIEPDEPNTGNVTVSINGADPVSAYDYTGGQFPAGAFSGRLFLTLEADGSLRSVMPADLVAQAQYWAELSEQVALPDGVVTTAKLADGSITAAKITDDSGEQEAIKEKLGLGSSIESLFLDQRVLTLMQSEHEGVPILLGGDGSALHDGFVTLDYVGVGSATNLDTSEESVLKPTSTIDSDSSPAADGTIFGNFDGTTFTRAFALDNGKTVAMIGLYATTAATYELKICKRNSSTSIDIVVSEAFAHAGGGWQDFELSSPYEVPASGTFHLGMYAPGIDDVPANEATDRIGGFGVGTNAGVGTGITTSESNGATAVLRAIYSIDYDALTVASVPLSIEGAIVPAAISLVALLTGDEVINSDAVFSVSRDEGTTWTDAVMAQMYTQPGNVRVMKSNPVDVSGQPSSAHVQWRLQTSNNANVNLLAAAVWGD